ncbi:MAG: hypothetical protein LBS19_15180 [Clostridiales bacterium]|nr:hypothetical protein [Clostridiales bacterium]
MKKLIAVALCFCLSLAALTVYADELRIDNSETGIGIIVQDYEGENAVEIMFFQYDGVQDAFEEYNWQNPTLELLNNDIMAGPWLIWQDYEEGTLELTGLPAEKLLIQSYPFDDGDNVQLVITSRVFPEVNHEEYTNIWSYNFRRSDNSITELDDMLEKYELTQESLYEMFEEFNDIEAVLASVEATGFIIDGEDIVFLLEVTQEGEADFFKDFAIYESETGEFRLLDPYSPFDEIYTPLLTADTTGMEEIDAGFFGLDGVFFLELQGFEAAMDTPYDEETLAARVAELEGAGITDLSDFKAEMSEDYSAMLTFPTWLCSYTVGDNEDMNYCTDLIFQTDTHEFRVHITVDADFAAEYVELTEQIFNSTELKDPVYSFIDYSNMIEMNYPVSFAETAESHNSGALLFHSKPDSQVLVYGASADADAQQELIDMAGMSESKELESGALIGWGEDYDAETDKASYVAYLWVMDAEEYFNFESATWYPAAAVICDTEEEAKLWYNRIENGDIYFLSVNGLDAEEGRGDFFESDFLCVSEEEAMNILADALYYKLDEGLTLVSGGASDMDGIPCWSFALGTDTEEKFTAEEHYVVTFEGEIFVYDVISDSYEPFAFG